MDKFQKNEDLRETFITNSDSILDQTHIDIESQLPQPEDENELINKKFRTIASVFGPSKKSDRKGKKINYNAYYRLVKYTKKEYPLLISGFAFLILSQVGGIILPYISGKILDVIITTRDAGSLNTYCGIFIGIFLLSSFAIFGRFISFSLLSERVSIALKNECFENVLT